MTGSRVVVALHEVIFLAIYALVMRPPSDFFASVKKRPVPYIVAFLWALSVTISLIWSPLGMGTEMLGLVRYQLTLLHVIFFFCLRDFLIRYPVPFHWLLLSIPATGFIVALGLAFQLLQLDSYDAAAAHQWFVDPPFNAHIRYIGYQIAAGIAALLAFFLFADRRLDIRLPLVAALVVLCTLLVWMGGRASLLAVIAAFGCLAVVAAVKGVRSRFLWLAFPISLAAGVFLADVFAVFPWNGILQAVAKTTEAADATQASSGRLTVWREAWESVRHHLVFGLGPEGYVFMPNRSFGVQPHSFLVQFVVEWGVIGALLFLGLIAYGFWCGFASHVVMAKTGLDLAALSAGAIIVALTALGLFDGTYYHPQPSLYLAIAFAVWTLPQRSEGEDREQPGLVIRAPCHAA